MFGVLLVDPDFVRLIFWYLLFENINCNCKLKRKKWAQEKRGSESKSDFLDASWDADMQNIQLTMCNYFIAFYSI